MNDNPESPLISPRGTDIAELKAASLTDLKEKLLIERHRDNVEQGLECCLCARATDKRLVILGSQLILSIMIVFFCFVKLAVSGEANEQVYITMLTSVFSYWTGRSTSSGTQLG